MLARARIIFSYAKPDGNKTYSDIEPYKLINHDGVWYLAALDDGMLKAFSMAKISRLQVLGEQRFERDPYVEEVLRREDSIWLNLKKTEVVLKVNAPAASYFRRRKLVPGQKIEKELGDGSMLVSTQVAHQDQILPLVRYWMPNISIISPEAYQEALKVQVRTFLAGL